MKLPNGYGSVINLGKKRRKPYAVRITIGIIQDENGKGKQKYKYLAYFEKSKDAHEYLAKYNSGQQVKEHVSLIEKPTFKEIYDKWIEYRFNMASSPSASTKRNYNLAFGWCSELHDKKFNSIRVVDIQNVVDKYKEKSESTVMTIKTVLKQMYEYAIKHEYIDKNYAMLADYEYKESDSATHHPFSDSEINVLWANIDNIQYVDIILMMIYTGFRASEFIALENKNIHIEERYIIGGMKTTAGKNRTVPIHKKVLPLFQKYYNKENKYLLNNTKGTKYSYGVFNISVWNVAINKLNMEHTPHDTRHTLATLLDRSGANKICIKNILGHSIQDITDGVYTHKTTQDLIEAIDMI